MIRDIFVNTMCTFLLFKLLKVLHFSTKKRAQGTVIACYAVYKYVITTYYFVIV